MVTVSKPERHRLRPAAMPVIPQGRAGDVDQLAAITCYYNPAGTVSLRHNLDRFRYEWRRSGVPLHIVEVIFGDLQPTIFGEHVRHVWVRDRIWHKETALNFAASHLPQSVRGVLWLDCDILWPDFDWIPHLMPALRLHPFVQLWSTLLDLDSGGRVIRSSASYAYDPAAGRPGAAWAARREYFTPAHSGRRKTAGLFSRCLVGGGDVASLIGMAGPACHYRYEYWLRRMSTHLHSEILSHASRVHQMFPGDIARVDREVRHLWHGSRDNRRYGERDAILEGFNPSTELTRDCNGFLQWVDPTTPRARQVTAYFPSRREDG